MYCEMSCRSGHAVLRDVEADRVALGAGVLALGEGLVYLIANVLRIGALSSRPSS